MNTLLLILWILLAVNLLVVISMRPSRAKQSRFELERLGQKQVLRRERLLGGVMVLLWLKAGVVIILLTAIGNALWQLWGVVLTAWLLGMVLFLARLHFVSRLAQRLYTSQEQRLLRIVELVKPLRWLGRPWAETHSDQRIESIEHFLHLVESAGHILSPEQQKLIKRGLRWHGKEVGKVMTPVEDIVSVRRSELLGPLVLDDLHKTGHYRFPVIGNGVDQILGQVNIQNLLEVDAGKTSQTAEHAMSSLDVRLHQDTPLPEALRQLMNHPGQLGLVIDDDDKTVGLVTLGDLLKALLG